MDPTAAKYIGAGIACIGMGGAGVGVGIIFGNYLAAAILEARRKRIQDDLAEAQRFKDASDAAIAAHEKALAEARARAQALANETRAKATAVAEARRKEVDAKLHARITEAEKAIAGTRSAALANVRSIAGEAAAAIVEGLTGIAPATEEVGQAVSNAIKRCETRCLKPS